MEGEAPSPDEPALPPLDRRLLFFCRQQSSRSHLVKVWSPTGPTVGTVLETLHAWPRHVWGLTLDLRQWYCHFGAANPISALGPPSVVEQGIPVCGAAIRVAMQPVLGSQDVQDHHIQTTQPGTHIGAVCVRHGVMPPSIPPPPPENTRTVAGKKKSRNSPLRSAEHEGCPILPEFGISPSDAR